MVLLLHDEAAHNIILSREFSQGDVESALAGSTVTVADRFRFHRHAAVAIENRACLAEWDAGTSRLTLWSSTQVPGMIREALAELLGIPVSHIRVVAPDVGGGFGMKSALYPRSPCGAGAQARPPHQVDRRPARGFAHEHAGVGRGHRGRAGTRSRRSYSRAPREGVG
jgi:CO/xanthine dehydrogenase Mo-binding subunit